jgi:hypothetical protein
MARYLQGTLATPTRASRPVGAMTTVVDLGFAKGGRRVVGCQTLKVGVLLAILGSLLPACSAAGDEPLETMRRPIVYGEDQRLDYFELTNQESKNLVAESGVALVARATLAHINEPSTSLASVHQVCPGEEFRRQPSIAFCSAVLIDWDLILTAAHCGRLFATADMVAMLGYYLDSPNHLASRAEDVIDIADIVAEGLGNDETVGGFEDYALMRLEHPVVAPRRPAAFDKFASSTTPGAAIQVISSPSGLPLKYDNGGHLRSPDPLMGTFAADTDTFAGSSGGGAFDAKGNLIGLLAQGDGDYVRTSSDCNQVIRREPSAAPGEMFEFVDRIVARFCASNGTSSICRPDCPQSCRALVDKPVAGCSYGRGATGACVTPAGILLVAASLLATRRARRCPRPQR